MFGAAYPAPRCASKHVKRLLLPALLAAGAGIAGCGHSRPPLIAAIPQMATDQIWLDEHAGVLSAANQDRARIYWNAPGREDDVQRQISLVDKVASGHYAGLVLAPAQELALMLPVERVLRRGLPVVIVHSPLTLPPGPHLAYIINDEESTGALAAEVIGGALHGRGRVALLGINPTQINIMQRVQSFESHLHSEYPRVQITERKPGDFDALASEQMATDALHSTPEVQAVLALDVNSALGAAEATEQMPADRRPILVACGQDIQLFDLLRRGIIRAVLAEDTFSMGRDAIEDILRMRHGLAVPPERKLQPIMITAKNLNDPAIMDKVANLPDEPL